MRIKRCQVKCITRKKNPVFPVDQADRIGRMSGRFQDLQLPPANVNDVALGDDLADRKRMTVILVLDESVRQRLPDPAFTNKFGHVLVWTAKCTSASKLGIRFVNGFELIIAADVIVVCVRIQPDDVQVGKLIDHASHVSDAKAGIKQECAVVAAYQERNDFLKLTRLVDREDPVDNPVHLEPIIVDSDPLVFAPLRPRQLIPPVAGPRTTILHLTMSGLVELGLHFRCNIGRTGLQRRNKGNDKDEIQLVHLYPRPGCRIGPVSD